MASIIPINDEVPRHRRRHSRHHSNLSLGTTSLNSLTVDDESEEEHHTGHSRKASFQEIPYNFAWSMSDSSIGGEEIHEYTEDDRQDARDRLLSDEDVRRERLLSEDCGGRERVLSEEHFFARNELETHFVPNSQPEDYRIEDQGFEVQLRQHEFDKLDEADPRRICFRGIVASCPEMPTLTDDDMDDSGTVSLVLRRTRAFTEDMGDVYHRSNSMDTSSGSVRVRQYGRSESMLIDQKYGSGNAEPLTESPTSTWVYWEENLNNPTPSSPFAAAFQEPQRF